MSVTRSLYFSRIWRERSTSSAFRSVTFFPHMLRSSIHCRPKSFAVTEQAWIDFSGWRVNYDAVLLNLAQFVLAPPVPWVSDRSPIRPEYVFTLRQAAMTSYYAAFVQDPDGNKLEAATFPRKA